MTILQAILPVVTAVACAGCAASDGPSVQEIIQLRHANVVTVAQRAEVREPGATVLPDPRTNSLVIRGSEQQVRAVREALEAIDAPPTTGPARG